LEKDRPERTSAVKCYIAERAFKNGSLRKKGVHEAMTAIMSNAPSSNVAHDQEMARRFLAALDPSADKFTFQLLSDLKGHKRHQEIIHGTLEELWPKVSALNMRDQCVGVFVTINETDGKGRKAENIVRVRAGFVDADGREQVAECIRVFAASGIQPSIAVKTGNGVHFYFCMDLGLDQFSEVQKMLIARLGTDASVKDLPRVMRLPGTLHLKDPNRPRLVKLLNSPIAPIRRWQLDELVSQLSLLTPAWESTNVVKFESVGSKSCPRVEAFNSPPSAASCPDDIATIRAAVKVIPSAALSSEHEWTRLARALAHKAALVPEQRRELERILDDASRDAQGYDEEENRRRFQRYVDEAFDHREPITIKTAYHMASTHGWTGWQPATTPKAPEPIAWSAQDLQVSFSDIPHRRWLYGTYLVRGEITILASPGGAGKTALAIGIAAEIAAGCEKLGERLWVKGNQKVLYISGEERRPELMRRICAFCRQHNISEHEIDRLSMAAAEDPKVQTMSFLQTREKTTVLDEDGLNSLGAALEGLRPDLVVLDPLVVFCGGGDMNGTVMSLVMRKLTALAARFDCAILVVHHTRKGRPGSDDPAEQAERISGAAATVNLARRAVMPLTMTDAEAKAYSILPSERAKYFKLADVKSNIAPITAEANWYELATVELDNSEPPDYPNGDRVQAVKRAHLANQKAASPLDAERLDIRFELMKLIDRGLKVDGEAAPYSPNSTGNNKKRGILEDAMAAIKGAKPERDWLPGDLRATVERELEALKHDGWATVERISGGRFRRGHGLLPAWERTPWAKERKNLEKYGGPTIRSEVEERELAERDLLQTLKAIESDGAI
jgi:hypothetical protein